MKIVIFSALILYLMTEIQADLSNQPSKIQSLVRKLFNLKPDKNIALSLGKPLKLNTDNELIDIESKEIQNVDYLFNNVTVSKLYINQRSKIYYTTLTCNFHQRLKITQAIDPPDLEITGLYEYDLKKSPDLKKPAEKFTIKQYDGRLIYTITSDGTTGTDIVYNDQQARYGESNKYLMLNVRAIGEVVTDVLNKTAKQLNQSNLPEKIKDFEHIFPFLSDSLSPLNKTALRSQDENMYIINNTKIERYERTYWIPSYVVIRGLNNFKQAKIIAYEDAKRVRFNLTLITSKLNGYFEWSYGRSENILMMANASQNFTIDNLTVTADTNFDKDWMVDNVRVDLGSIILQKPNATEEHADINEVAYDIFHENLQTTIKSHLEQLIHKEYSQPGKSEGLGTSTNEINTTSTYNQNTTEGRFTINLLNQTTVSTSMSNDTDCKDDRRWWQKIYRRNKCKQSKKPTTKPVPETKKCVDKRWWFQKLFASHECAKNVPSMSTSATQPIPTSVSSGSTPATQQMPTNASLESTTATQQTPEVKVRSDLQQDEMKKCVDTRWWFQKPFIRNKCKPKRNV